MPIETVRGFTEFSKALRSNSCTSLNPNIRAVEVAIHTILYVRQIYPADLFVRRKKYDTPVYRSRHPGLNDYISGAVKAVGEELVLVCFLEEISQSLGQQAEIHQFVIQGNVDKVVVVIKNKEETPMERFIFAVQNMIEVEPYNKDTRFGGPSGRQSHLNI